MVWRWYGKIYDLDSRLSGESRVGGRCLRGLREAGRQGGDSCTGAGCARLGLCTSTRGSPQALVSQARGEARGEGVEAGSDQTSKRGALLFIRRRTDKNRELRAGAAGSLSEEGAMFPGL